jgi:NAD(P)-dependent dehydrogenase (short-subunit alcohol dehydrogenase family)
MAHGSIVTIASTRALMSEPDTESYSASKGGIVALTHAAAVSLGPDIRVNCVSPG